MFSSPTATKLKTFWVIWGGGCFALVFVSEVLLLLLLFIVCFCVCKCPRISPHCTTFCLFVKEKEDPFLPEFRVAGASRRRRKAFTATP